MRETFKHRRRGDRLSAQQVNDLSRVSRAQASGSISANRYGQNYSGQAGTDVEFSWRQDNLIVVAVLGNGLYRVRHRVFDRQVNIWLTNLRPNEEEMDASDREIEFEVGDKVTGYWDTQRNMWIPIVGEAADDRMWCAELCDCALEREPGDCCVYRGRVKRYDVRDAPITVGNACDPPRIVKPAFILADCGDLIPPVEGWVRKIQDEITITWTPSTGTTEVTETLELYEWCCWKPPECPSEDEVMNASFGHSDSDCNDILKAIPPVKMDYREDGVQPEDNAKCDHDGWVGEFKVETTQVVRVFEVSFLVDGEPYLIDGEEEETVGWVRPDPVTGNAVELYVDVNGDLTLVGGNWTIERVADALCRPLILGADQITESVTRYYRVRAACTEGDIHDVCVQHLYPPGHRIYSTIEGHPMASAGAAATPTAWRSAYSSEDAQALETLVPICPNDFIGTFDFQFGEAHIVEGTGGLVYPLLADGPHPLDGWFYGAQWRVHTFAGCFNLLQDSNTECEIAQDFDLVDDVTIRVTW